GALRRPGLRGGPPAVRGTPGIWGGVSAEQTARRPVRREMAGALLEGARPGADLSSSTRDRNLRGAAEGQGDGPYGPVSPARRHRPADDPAGGAPRLLNAE